MQPLALQFRVGTSGDYANVPDGFVADATATGATVSTTIDVPLPAAADDRPVVQVRILTTDAPGSDEWVGIDDLSITSTGVIERSGRPGRHLPVHVGLVRRSSDVGASVGHRRRQRVRLGRPSPPHPSTAST